MQDIYEDFDPMIFRLWDAPERGIRAGGAIVEDDDPGLQAIAPEMKSTAGTRLQNPRPKMPHPAIRPNSSVFSSMR